MSARDFNGRLFAPVIALPRRPLSNKESTASCNMRFSLRTIISGAFNSSKRFKRLLRLITRRYKSLRSDVANRPPSSGTSGRNSGGNVGSTVITIHSGLIPDFLNASNTLRRFESFFILVSELVAAMSRRRLSTSTLMFRLLNRSRIPSAPILALKSSPYSSILAR